MLLRTVALHLALATPFAFLVSAQSPIVRETLEPPVVTIQVGGTSSSPGGITQFSPNLVVAAAGTVVRFQFTGFPGNHSVTQSSFASPCQPLAGGFDSGWVFVNESLPSPPEWNLTITDDLKPIWFYCKQLLKTPHCNAGMVGAINVQASNKSFDDFQSIAKAATSVLPGQSEGAFTGVGAVATAVPFLPPGVAYVNPNVGATVAQGRIVTVTTTASGSDISGSGTASTVVPTPTNEGCVTRAGIGGVITAFVLAGISSFLS